LHNLKVKGGKKMNKGRIFLVIGGVLLISLLFVKCKGEFGDSKIEGQEQNKGKCWGDPDNPICEGDWICEGEGEGKVCTQAGLSRPTEEDWKCEDEGERLICFTQGKSEVPSDSPWQCEYNEEFDTTICEILNPEFPDKGEDEKWDCFYTSKGERICESGSKADWECKTENGRTECKIKDIPGEGNWECSEYQGKLVCTSKGGEVPSTPSDRRWECEKDEHGNSLCTKSESRYPDSGGRNKWKCWFDNESGNRICEDKPKGTDLPLDCECIPGAERWCDGENKCAWGKQVCEDVGKWGPCIEDHSKYPAGCKPGHYDVKCCVEVAKQCCQNIAGPNTPYDPSKPLDASVGNCKDLICE
jgi:hypothetical protein